VEITMLANDTDNAPATLTQRERTPWSEIRRRYPDAWVVLVDFERPNYGTDGDLSFTHAVVLAHHRTRKEASPDVKAALQRGEEAGSFFTGRLIPLAYELLVP